MSTKFRGAVLCAARMSVVRWEGEGWRTSWRLQTLQT